MPSIYEAGDERKRRQRQHVLHKIVCRVCEGTFQVFGGQVNLFKYCGVECRREARRRLRRANYDPVVRRLTYDPGANRRQYVANREKRLAQAKAWRAVNKARRKSYQRKEYTAAERHQEYLRSREKRLAYCKAYKTANRDSRNAAKRKRYAEKKLAREGTAV